MWKIIITFLLFQVFLFAKLEDDIRSKCVNEYRDGISEYLIRMEDDIESYGCRVIPIYNSIIESENFDILDSLEEDTTLIENFLKIFYMNDDISHLLFKSSVLKRIVLNNGMNDEFVRKFLFLLKKELHKKDISRIEKDRDYLNYYLLSSFYAKDKRETVKLFKKMKNSISLELLPSFTLLLSSIGDTYTFENLLESFTVIQKELSIDAIKNLAHYSEYFVYLLYPREVDLNLGTVSSYKLKERQKEMQRKALFLYQEMYEQYRYRQGLNHVDYALLSVANIYPYLLEEERLEYDDFVVIVNRLIKKDYFLALFEEGKCSNKSKENFAIFGQGNLLNAHEFLKNEKRFSLQLLEKLKNDTHSVFSFFYVANFYNSVNSEEWSLFKELFKTLPSDSTSKIAFLKKLEVNGYFRNIIAQDDYRKRVEAEDGSAYPKYKYILTTPYPNQSDPSLFEQILTTQISDKELKEGLLELIQKDTDELATHTFTTFDKFARGAAIADKIEDGVFVASLLAAPFTGGFSLSYVAIEVAKKATKIGAKKGFKAMIKRVALQSRELTNKAIRKVKVGRKSLNGDVAGVKNVKKSGETMDKTENLVGNINSVVQVSAFAGSTLYLYLNSSELLTKQICEEQ